MNDNVLGHIQHYFSHIIVDYKKQLKDYLIANKNTQVVIILGLNKVRENICVIFIKP